MLIAIVCALLLVAGNKWYWKNPEYKLSDTETTLLQQLGDSALAHGDIPVAALLVYDHKIVGTGYNDVSQHNNVAGHAEINAISSAIRTLGFTAFTKLNREKLVLITTWEPCNMCSGAITQYNIQRVVAVQIKSRRHWWNEWKKKARYEWNLQTASPDTLQNYLFRKHPDFEREKDNL